MSAYGSCDGTKIARATRLAPREEDARGARGGLMAWATRGEVHGTLVLLRWLRSFVTSEASEARDPWGATMACTFTRADAKEKLAWLVDVAVNRRGRKAGQAITHGLGEGWTDGPSGRTWTDFYRDARALEDLRVRRVRIYQFSSKVCRARLGHLLATRED